jgi:hypothetical protein
MWGHSVEIQNLFNIAVGLILSVAGWMAKQMFVDIRAITRDLHKIEVDLPTTYVSKHEFHERLGRIEILLERIYEKLDGKADR